jgi:hypothetical protein
MSVYTIRNLIGKFTTPDIRVLYARPAEIINTDILTNHLADNIIIYDLPKILDLSWFGYDILLTHQINGQILELAHNMHIPIVCYAIKGVADNYNEKYLNTYYLPESGTNKDLVAIFESLKHKRFIL